MRRSYGQYCGLANALDLVGERWTLLLVRDLATGPKRFTDLLDGLPGMGPSLLSERLRHLEASGIATRALAGRDVVYELTPDGLGLANALAPLAIWGATRLGPHMDEQFRPAWLMFALRSSFDRSASAGVHDCYEFRVDGVVVWVVVDDGEITVTQERPREPNFVMTTDVPTLAAVGSGRIAVGDAVASGAAHFEGSAAAGARALRLLGSAGAEGFTSPTRRQSVSSA